MTLVPSWQANPVWQTVGERGVLVIESDDGTVGDYTHWRPLLARVLAGNASPWAPFTARGVACSAINRLGDGSTVMNAAQAQALEAAGWEILAHGVLHCGLNRYHVTQPITAGNTRLDLMFGGRMVTGGGDHPQYVYTITNGAASESFTITGSDGALGNGWCDLTDPISNSYGTYEQEGTYVVLSEASTRYEVETCKSDLLAAGLDVQHYAYPFGPVAPEIIPIIAESYGSARTTEYELNLPGEFDVYQLAAFNIASLIGAGEDDVLDAAVEHDGLLMMYLHGETDAANAYQYTRLIEKAKARRMAIMNRREALAYYSGKYGAWWLD